MPSIDRLDNLSREGSRLKDQANRVGQDHRIYLQAQAQYNEAYRLCKRLCDIEEILRDFLCTIYWYESLDCAYAFFIKEKNFESAVDVSERMTRIIDRLFRAYKKGNLNRRLLGFYQLLENHKISARAKSHFANGKEFFKRRLYVKALYHFRRWQVIFEKTDESVLDDRFLLANRINRAVLRFNICQCQVGLLKEGLVKNSALLERQIVKALLEGRKYNEELIALRDDPSFQRGIDDNDYLLINVLTTSINGWDNLYAQTASEHLLRLMQRIDSNRANQVIVNPVERRHDYLLFYTHGFWTRGAWKNTFTEIVTNKQRETNVTFTHVPWDYGTFIMQFFIGFRRRVAVSKFIKEYTRVLDTYGPCDKRCIVAHSFGTYIIGTAIQEHPHFICEKIIFAGNILDRHFDWDNLKNNNQTEHVLIEQSTNDMPVFLAKLFRKYVFQKWIGDAGREGFSKQYDFVRVRVSESGHSGMLTRENMEQQWIPFLFNE